MSSLKRSQQTIGEKSMNVKDQGKNLLFLEEVIDFKIKNVDP